MARVEGVKEVIKKLRQRGLDLLGKSQQAARGHGGRVSVAVGYTAKYALFVHENREPKTLGQGVPRPSGLGVYWGPSQYGPGFLIGPMREFAKELGDIVITALGKGKNLAQGLLLAGLRLQRESQQRVPVEYGILRASAFTELEEE